MYLKRGALAASVAGLVIAALSACGSGSSGSTPAPASSAPASGPATLLPAADEASGTLTFGADLNYPPFTYETPSGTPTGVDVELAQAIAKQLGVKAQFSNASFETLVTGLKAKRFDLVMSAFRDTPADYSSVDFVDYIKAGGMLLVKKGNPAGISVESSLCGKSVGYPTGSVTLQNTLQAATKACAAAAKQAIDIQQFSQDATAQLSLQEDRLDAYLIGAGTAAYYAKTQPGKYQTTGSIITSGYYGIVVPKGNDQLVAALRAAVDAIIKDGEYAKVLSSYGLSSAAVQGASLNAGTAS